MRVKILRSVLLAAALVCLLTVTAFAYEDPADVSDPNYFSGSTTFCMVIDSNHTLWTKGINTSGQMGLGVVAENMVISDTFSKVMDGVASVTTFQEDSVAAVRTDGSLWTWGSNVGARLGYPDGVETEWFGTVQPTPKKVMDNVAAASIGPSGVVAIKAALSAVNNRGAVVLALWPPAAACRLRPPTAAPWMRSLHNLYAL